jgi:hypothetical protein
MIPATVAKNDNISIIPGASSDKNALRNGNAITTIARMVAAIFLFMIIVFKLISKYEFENQK